MKRSITFMAITLFILVSCLAIGVKGLLTFHASQNQDKAYKLHNDMVQKQRNHGQDLPYRDDADYSGHNDIFQMEGDLPASKVIGTQ